jgi:heterotetrameric sarcosine oxidase gamma subunit
MELWGARTAVESRLGRTLPGWGAVERDADAVWLWWEPNLWLARAAEAQETRLLERLSSALDGAGAVTVLSGAFARFTLLGATWRSFLMIGAVFDAESSAFKPGQVAGTMLHHLPVWIEAAAPDRAEVYVPSSYADALWTHWSKAARRPARS